MKLKRNSKSSIIVSGLIVSLFFLQNYFRDLGTQGTAFIPEVPQYYGLKINTKIISRFLGTRILFADLAWIDLLIKSDYKKVTQPYSDFYKVSKNIVSLDPYNYLAYHVLGTYLSVIKDDVDGAVDLLRAGAKSLDENIKNDKNISTYYAQISSMVYFDLAYNLIIEKKEMDEGALWAKKAASFEFAPQIVKGLAEKVSTEYGRIEIESRMLNATYATLQKDEEKKIVEEKLLDLAVKQELAELKDKFLIYLRSTGAFALPKEKAFKNFLRNIGHSGLDIKRRKIFINEDGKLQSK